MTTTNPEIDNGPSTCGAARNGFRVEIDLARCSACRSCEVACSFHHTRTYDPCRSAVQITYDGRTGAVTAEFTDMCDGCVGVPGGPRCVHYCPVEAAHMVD